MPITEVLAASPALFTAFASVLGLIVGSFLNVVIHRVPKMLEAEFRHECACLDLPDDAEPPARPVYNLVLPRSACPHCNTPIAGYDNIPVVSWLLLRGRCRHCKAPISVRYPAIELLSGVLTACAAAHFGFGMAALGAMCFVWTMIALFFIDADTFLLPDSITLPFLWLGLGFNLAGTYVTLPHAVVGAMGGYLCLWLVYWAFKLITGKEGMGYGDFKLLAGLGAWLGWQSLPVIILLSSVAGSLIGIALVLLSRLGWNTRLPFGPYLAVAGVAALFWGPALQTLIWH